MTRRQEKLFRSLGIALVLMLLALCAQMIVSGTTFASDRVVVWVFDVGQGDAIFIDAPQAQILIDGGGNSDVLQKLTRVMPFWDRHIDLLVNTHPHADHVTGMVHVLDRYEVGEVWTSGQGYGTDIYDAFESFASPPFEGGARGGYRAVQSGDTFDLGLGATLRVLWPNESASGRLENPHDANVTMLLTYGETTILLTGDMEGEVEAQLLDDVGHIDVLKVGHHGSLTSTTSELLEDTTPDYAVISVGSENDYGHPHPVVLDRLETFGVQVLRTDVDHDVRITTDGGEPSLTLFDL